MLETLDDILEDRLVNHFEDIAKSYGLEGIYLKYYTSATAKEDIYFVCGINKSDIHIDGLNVEKISADKQKQYLNFNPYIAAFKITRSDPLLTHQAVIEYCQTAEFLNKLYQEHNTPLPRLIPEGIVDGLKMLHYNASNPALPKETRDSYKRDIRETLKKQDNLFTDHGNDSSKAAYYLYQQYDTKKGKLANWLKRVFSKDKNRVSMEHLVTSCKEITTIGIHVSDAQTIKSELQNRPEIIYWMSDKAIGQKLDCPDNQGYGSQKANDRRYIPFAFDSKYSSDFIAMVNRIEHPDGYKHSAKELVARYPIIQHTTIPSSDYHKYVSALNSKGIKFCINDTATNTETINLVLATDVEKNIDKIIDAVALQNETEHLYTNAEERQAIAKSEFLETKRSELEIAMIQRAEEFLGSSDVELLSVSGDMLSNDPTDMSDDLFI